jgi:hypothetical protein
VVAVLGIMMLSKKVRLVISLFNWGIVVVLLLTVIFLFLPEDNDIKIALSNRVNSLTEFSKGSGLGRVQGYILGFEGFLKNPVFGNGTLSTDTEFYNTFRNQHQELMGSAGWLNGALIQALQDTGIIGFLIVLGIFISVLIANYNVFIKLPDWLIEKSIILGFIGGNIILLISSQFSSPLWISFPYIYWGINMSYLGYCKKQMQVQTSTS